MLCLLVNIWDGNTTMTIDVENEKTNKTINNKKTKTKNKHITAMDDPFVALCD